MASRPPRPPHGINVKKEFRIKKEVADEDIKEYAETAMNELLGWYGYDKLSSRDTQALDLHHFTRHHTMDDGDSSDSNRSSSPPRSTPSAPDVGENSCCWCNKGAPQKTFTLKTSCGVKSFCSELCFTQCRRANFKRNKTCDWCRHIRHTVNYVDFQDGQQQLQFCSDKCLNQYKMNIFCKETEAHLQLHPHLAEGPSGAPSTGLITPEMWLRDCRSPSPPTPSSTPPPEPPRERKKQPRFSKRTKSPTRAQSFPPPLLPLGGLLPPPRPPFNLGAAFGIGGMRGPRPPCPQSPPSHPPGVGLHPGARHPYIPPARSLLPPVTILVPHPIPIPIPVPIPLPIPIPIDMTKLPFYKLPPKECEKQEEELTAKPEDVAADKKDVAAAPRPLRKRRRLPELPKDENIPKKKSVSA